MCVRSHVRKSLFLLQLIDLCACQWPPGAVLPGRVPAQLITHPINQSINQALYKCIAHVFPIVRTGELKKLPKQKNRMTL